MRTTGIARAGLEIPIARRSAARCPRAGSYVSKKDTAKLLEDPNSELGGANGQLRRCW
jgi:hypothetical protein